MNSNKSAVIEAEASNIWFQAGQILKVEKLDGAKEGGSCFFGKFALIEGRIKLGKLIWKESKFQPK